MLRKIFKFLSFIILSLSLILILFLGWQTIFEFKPEAEENLPSQPSTGVIDDTLSLVTWNVGYSGLGAEMDFFYEGGTMVRPDLDRYKEYNAKVQKRLSSMSDASIVLLQEVDTLARRSHYDNQLKELRSMPGYQNFFAINYNTWVPVPVTNPMGKVRAGVVTMSKYTPASAKRVSFNSSYDWPTRLFMLKRCFLELRYKTSDGKELIVINTHNSAFDDAAAMRDEELAMLKKIMINEYAKGNYVVIGGDWNQNPPSFDTSTLLNIYRAKYIEPGIPDEFMPEGWTCAFDPLHTTNRDVNTPYIEGKSVSTLIDFFVLSPNIKLLQVNTLPTGYKESDHQPVFIKIAL